VLVNVNHLLRGWPQLTPNRFNLRIEPALITPFVTALQARFALDDSRIVDQAGSRAGPRKCSNAPSPPPPRSTA
jgi:hypothetical protein